MKARKRAARHQTRRAYARAGQMPVAMRHVESALGRAGVNIDIIDSGFIIRYVDPAWSRIYGNPVGKKCYRVFEGRSSVCPGCGIRKAIRTRKVSSYEAVLRKEGGRPIHVITVPFTDERGDRMVAEVNIDIAERKKAEKVIRESDARFSAIADFAHDYIFAIAPDLTVTYVNRFAAAVLRKRPERIIGRRIDKLFPSADYRRMALLLRRVFATGKPFGSEEVFVFPAGSVWLSTRFCPIKDAAGKTVSVLGISRDISALKKAEGILERDKKALERLVRDKTTALLEAQKKLDQSERLAEIGTLAATVAHELRNPLAAIRTAVFNIRRKTGDIALESHMTNIERKIQESDQIINNLLTYGKITMPDVVIVDLCTLLDECVDSARSRYSGYAVTVRKGYKSPCVVKADPIQIKEVFNNILNNSYEAMPGKKGALEINVKEIRGRSLRVGISDTGEGIPEYNIRRVHEPFFSTKKIGTGLGLPICHKIIQLHNGSITTKSVVGKGTTIEIDLPIMK